MDLAKHWRQRAARYRLEGQRHRDTGAIQFPPNPDADPAWQPFALSGRGQVFSFTVVRQPPDGYDAQAPYILALVQLAEGPLLTAQLTDCDPEHVAIDMQVEMVTRKLIDLGEDGLLVYGPKFRPLVGA
jgi:uncharacterized OB-fold protein